jgi:hypothetical protein
MTPPGFLLLKAGYLGARVTYNEIVLTKTVTYNSLGHDPNGWYGGFQEIGIEYKPIDNLPHVYRFRATIWVDTQGNNYGDDFPFCGACANDMFRGGYIINTDVTLNSGNGYTYSADVTYHSQGGSIGVLEDYNWSFDSYIVWTGYFGHYLRKGGDWTMSIIMDSLEDDPPPPRNVMQMLIEQN